jgi:hypothetical protein
MIKVKLLFQTDSGCDCLVEEHEFGFVSMGEVRRRAQFMARQFWNKNKETGVVMVRKLKCGLCASAKTRRLPRLSMMHSTQWESKNNC